MVEGAIADRLEEDLVDQLGPLGEGQGELVLLHQAVDVEPDRAREGLLVAAREVGVADQRQAVAVVGRELGDPGTAAGGVLAAEEAGLVGPAPARRRRPLRQADAPAVDEAHLEQGLGADQDGRDELGVRDAHPDREAFDGGTGEPGEVGLDGVAVAEAEKRLALGLGVARVGLESASKDDVLEVRQRHPGRLGTRAGGLDRDAAAGDGDHVRVAFDHLSAQKVDGDLRRPDGDRVQLLGHQMSFPSLSHQGVPRRVFDCLTAPGILPPEMADFRFSAGYAAEGRPLRRERRRRRGMTLVGGATVATAFSAAAGWMPLRLT